MIDYTGNSGWKIEVNPTLFLVIFGVIFAVLIFTTVRTFANYRKNTNNYSDDNSCSKPLKLKSTKATVLSKREDGHYEGSYKQPRFVNDYYVEFMTEKNKKVELKVTKHFFDKTDIGRISTLITQNGEFFDFSDGEIED